MNIVAQEAISPISTRVAKRLSDLGQQSRSHSAQLIAYISYEIKCNAT